LTISIALLPTAASAHGPRLRGLEIDRATQLRPLTSYCICDERWFTVGLKPGAAQVSVSSVSCASPEAPTCGVDVSVSRASKSGRQIMASGHVSCDVHPKLACSGPLHLTYQVSQTGVYYILAQGLGAFGIRFTLAVSGRIYPLNCHKYC
jgi:hypothetical protein